MIRSLVFLAVATASASTPAQESSWNGAAELTIHVSSHAFRPNLIHLRAGQPVVLHLINSGSDDHSFSAPEFFAAASIRYEDQGLVYKGSIEMPPHEIKDLALIPHAGDYKLRCGYPLHAILGEQAEIVVTSW